MKKTSSEQTLIPEVVEQPAQEMIKVEKSLNYISLFSSNSTARRTRSSKSAPDMRIRTIKYPAREIDGKTVIPKTRIAPHPELGLPTAGDRDKFMAFMKIVTERKAHRGSVENPVTFSTYELLKSLGLTDSGQNYEDVNTFLVRMVSTTIQSEYAVYLNGVRKYAKDYFHVFNRVILSGQELPDGTIAQLNHVFLSDWQIENINTNYTFPIDFHSYQRLTRPISKGLFGHLHTWFYASKGRPVERKYSELCELLDIQRYEHPSKIRQVLDPPIDELKSIGYLRSWDLTRTNDNAEFKIILGPGPSILAVTRPRLATGQEVTDVEMDKVIEALTKRGVREADARRLLLDVDLETQPVMDQIEWFDLQLSEMGRSMTSPSGFLVATIRDNWPVPANFESSRKRQIREDARNAPDQETLAKAQLELRKLDLATEYDSWVENQVNAAIQKLSTEQQRKKLKAIKKQVLTKNPALYPRARDGQLDNCPSLAAHANALLRKEVRASLNLPSMEAFAGERQKSLFDGC